MIKLRSVKLFFEVLDYFPLIFYKFIKNKIICLIRLSLNKLKHFNLSLTGEHDFYYLFPLFSYYVLEMTILDKYLVIFVYK